MRQIFGWDRYDTDLACQAMNDLYEKELRWFQNLFQPSLKLKQKVRVGSKVIRRYERAKTPLQRVLESKAYDRAKVRTLQELQTALDPFELSKTIDRKLEDVVKMASERLRIQPVPQTHAPVLARPYSDTAEFSRKNRRLRKTMIQLKRQADLKT